MTNSPKTITVNFADNSTDNDVGAAVEDALASDVDVSSFFYVSNKRVF